MTEFSFPTPPLLPEGTPAAPAVFDPELFPSRHRPWWQWVLDHNPCLLFSTVFMLLGCYLVNSALHDRESNIKILGLLAVINVYEACIIPLGLALIRRTRGTARDGWWLLLFETLFLVNASFINVDFGPRWGIPFNLLLFVLACVKAGVILRGLKIGLGLRTFGFFAVQLGLVYGLPILFALVNVDGVVSPRIMYGLWWVVGLLPLAYDLVARWDGYGRGWAAGARWDLVQQVIRRVYLMAPWVMLVAHLGFSHWAHHSDFVLADLSPVLFGVAIASMRLQLRGQLWVVVRILPALAAVLSMSGGSLSWGISMGDELRRITPAHLTFAAMLMCYGYLGSPFYFACSAAAVFLGAVGYVFEGWIVRAIRRAAELLFDLFPDTAASWGVAAIIVAFMLLGVGSLVGLRRTTVTSRPAG